MTGWRGNELGLVKWQVLHIHDERLRLTKAVQDRVLSGKTFDEAKAAVVKEAAASWKALQPNLQAGLTRAAQDIRFADLGERVFEAIERDLIRNFGKEPTWLRRFLLRVTGKVW